MIAREVVDAAVWAVSYAKNHRLRRVLGRGRLAQRLRVFGAGVRRGDRAGAKTLNVPDTTGYAIPAEFGALFGNLIERTAGGDG